MVKSSAYKQMAIAFVVLLVVGACSVTDYGPALTKFSEATQNSEKALSELDKEVVQARAEVLRSQVASGDYRVEFGKTKDDDEVEKIDCQFDSLRCKLVIVNNDNDNDRVALRPGESMIPNMLAVMRGVRVYAENLTALVNADTAATATANVNAALGSIEDLANTVNAINRDPKNTEPVPEFATPVGQAAGWLIGQYVARVQLEGLKTATGRAKDTISDAAALFEEAGEVAAFVPKVRLADAVLARNDAYALEPSAANFDKLVESSSAYDLFLQTGPSNIFMGLKTAHDALTNSLHQDDFSYADALAKIEAFAAEAGKLKKIIDDLRVLGDGQEN